MHPFQLFLDKFKSKTSDRFDVNMENTTNHHHHNIKHNINCNYDESVPLQMTQMISDNLENNSCSTPVTVNVYDMIWLNEYINLLGIGVYHTGVVIYGTEYCYGGHPLNYSGIFAMLPRDSESLGENYSFRTTLLMGHTDFNPTDISLIIENMGPEYRGDQYHLLHKNCNHFTNEFVKILCGRSLPKWINRLATVGAKLPFVEKSLPKEWLTPRPIETQTSSVNEDDVLDGFDPYLKLERKSRHHHHHHHQPQQQKQRKQKHLKEQDYHQHHSKSAQIDFSQNVIELTNNSMINIKDMKKSLLRRWNSERFFNNSKKLFKSTIFEKSSNTSSSSSLSNTPSSLLVLDKSLSHLSFIKNSNLKPNQYHNHHSNSVQYENNPGHNFFSDNNNHRLDNKQLITSDLMKMINSNHDNSCLHHGDHHHPHSITYDHPFSLMSTYFHSNHNPTTITTNMTTPDDSQFINLSKNISKSEQLIYNSLNQQELISLSSSTSLSSSGLSTKQQLKMEEKLNLSKKYFKSNQFHNSLLFRLKSDLHKKYIKFYIYNNRNNKVLNNKTKLNNKSIHKINQTQNHDDHHTNNTDTTDTTNSDNDDNDNNHNIENVSNTSVVISSSCSENDKNNNNEEEEEEEDESLNYSSISIISSLFDHNSNSDPNLNIIYNNCNSIVSIPNQNDNLQILSSKLIDSNRNLSSLSSPRTTTTTISSSNSSCFSTSTSRRLFHRIQNLCASGIKDSRHSQINTNQCFLFSKN